MVDTHENTNNFQCFNAHPESDLDMPSCPKRLPNFSIIAQKTVGAEEKRSKPITSQETCSSAVSVVMIGLLVGGATPTTQRSRTRPGRALRAATVGGDRDQLPNHSAHGDPSSSRMASHTPGQ